MSLSKVIEIARLELGVTENPPGSNRVKYWDAYDPKMQGQPWCVCFLWWVFQQAGERMAFFGGDKTASCSMLLRWYKEQGLTVDVSEVQPGDIVILNSHGTKDPEHCGLVADTEQWKRAGVVAVTTIEGNTSSGDGSQDNGGCVAMKQRYQPQIVGVCRPQYKPDDPQPVDDVTGRWSEADIRWCIEHGLMEGYPDGRWKPKQAVTREELAVVLRRFHRMMEDDGK